MLMVIQSVHHPIMTGSTIGLGRERDPQDEEVTHEDWIKTDCQEMEGEREGEKEGWMQEEVRLTT